MIAVHSQDGRHFLGLRQTRDGKFQIVYEGGRVQRRLVWTLKSPIDDKAIGQHHHQAIRTTEVLDALCAGLRGAEIGYELEERPSI